MIGNVVKVAAFVATTSVSLPYVMALVCNMMYGWPRVKNCYRRAFSPRKVFCLNVVVIQKIIVSLRFLPLYLQWKAFYKMATCGDVLKNCAYGRNNQELDLYFPKKHQEGDSRPLPVVVFVYGGAWGSGHKKEYGLLCSAVANKLGAIVCCPNHSTYPQGHIEDMVQDVIDCMFWLYKNVEQYNGDKTKMMLLGHSSGAHICIMSMMELLHDELVTASNPDLQPITVPSIQFDDRHFASRSQSQSDVEINEDRQSSASSGSFCVIGKNDNGSQSDEQQTSRFEVLSTQKSETEMSEGSLMESDLQELNQSTAVTSGVRYRGTSPDSIEGATSESKGGHSSDVNNEREVIPDETEEGDDFADDDSIVTVKCRDNEGHEQLDQQRPTLTNLSKSLKAVIGLAGVYHIGDHFKHESGRGIEDISTMARSMHGQEYFHRYSPTHIVQGVNKKLSLPKIVLVHGTEDYVVPLSSTTKFAEALKHVGDDITVRIIPGCDHYEVCLDLMIPSRKYNQTVMKMIEETAKAVFSK